MPLGRKNIIEGILAGLITTAILWLFATLVGGAEDRMPNIIEPQNEETPSISEDGEQKAQSAEDILAYAEKKKSDWNNFQETGELLTPVALNPLILFQVASSKQLAIGTFVGILCILLFIHGVVNRIKDTLLGCSMSIYIPFIYVIVACSRLNNKKCI